MGGRRHLQLNQQQVAFNDRRQLCTLTQVLCFKLLVVPSLNETWRLRGTAIKRDQRKGLLLEHLI